MLSLEVEDPAPLPVSTAPPPPVPSTPPPSIADQIKKQLDSFRESGALSQKEYDLAIIEHIGRKNESPVDSKPNRVVPSYDDQMAQLKSFLTSGIITQEEYDESIECLVDNRGTAAGSRGGSGGGVSGGGGGGGSGGGGGGGGNGGVESPKSSAEQISQLNSLKASGILTQKEYDESLQYILASSGGSQGVMKKEQSNQGEQSLTTKEIEKVSNSVPQPTSPNMEELLDDNKHVNSPSSPSSQNKTRIKNESPVDSKPKRVVPSYDDQMAQLRSFLTSGIITQAEYNESVECLLVDNIGTIAGSGGGGVKKEDGNDKWSSVLSLLRITGGANEAFDAITELMDENQRIYERMNELEVEVEKLSMRLSLSLKHKPSSSPLLSTVYEADSLFEEEYEEEAVKYIKNDFDMNRPSIVEQVNSLEILKQLGLVSDEEYETGVQRIREKAKEPKEASLSLEQKQKLKNKQNKKRAGSLNIFENKFGGSRGISRREAARSPLTNMFTSSDECGMDVDFVVNPEGGVKHNPLQVSDPIVIPKHSSVYIKPKVNVTLKKQTVDDEELRIEAELKKSRNLRSMRKALAASTGTRGFFSKKSTSAGSSTLEKQHDISPISNEQDNSPPIVGNETEVNLNSELEANRTESDSDDGEILTRSRGGSNNSTSTLPSSSQETNVKDENDTSKLKARLRAVSLYIY